MDEKLLIGYYEGRLTAEELSEVEEWIVSSESNRKTAEEIYKICFASDLLRAWQTADTEKALADVKARIRARQKKR